MVASTIYSVPALATSPEKTPPVASPDLDPGKTPAPPPGPSEDERGYPENRPDGPSQGENGTLKDVRKGPGRFESVEGLEEAVSLRSAGLKMFKVPGGGAHIAQIFARPIHYVDDRGQWREIDTSISRVPGGFASGANEFDVFFPERLTPGTGVRVDEDGRSVSVTIAGASPAEAEAADGTVTYRRIAEDTDLRYRMTTTGYKEEVVLRSTAAPASVEFGLRTDGLSLELLEDGTVEIRDGESVFGSFLPFFAEEAPDADGVRGEATHDIPTQLEELSPGRYRLTASIDPAWLAKEGRRFPVVLDPWFVTSRCGACPTGVGAPLIKDMYIDPSGARNWTGTQLLVGRNMYGQDWRTYMTFDVAQEMRNVGDLVYDARFNAYNQTQLGTGPGPTQIHRITDNWEQTTGPVPSVDETKVWAERAVSASPGWWEWNVKGILQYWMDMGIPSNHGFRMSVKPGSYNDYKAFMSKETSPEYMPYIYATVNAMPSTRPFVVDDAKWPYLDLADGAPKDGDEFGSTPPVLKIKDLTDVNGDPIRVRYQVSRDRSFSGSQLMYDSGWIPEEHQHTVPLSRLTTTGTYYWRVQAGDVCDAEDATYVDVDDVTAQKAGLCDDLSHDQERPNKTHVERPTSEVRSFILQRKSPRRGTDRRWSMWREELGNGMKLAVDSASGNLSLRYPVDSLQTAAGRLDLGLSFNSDGAARDYASPGLPPGWDLFAGPGGRASQVPIRIEEPYSNLIEVVYASGRRDPYTSTDGVTYKTVGPNSQTVRRMPGGSWLMTSPTGGAHSFNSSGDLDRARASTSSHLARGFQYQFSSWRKLSTITDPNGRVTRFEYLGPNGKLSRITPWTGGAWTLTYDQGQRLVGVKDPAGATVGFSYDSSGRLVGIKDGAQSDKADGVFTTIAYTPRADTQLVSSVTLPGSTQSWKFTYEFGDAQVKIANRTTIIDPRAALTPDDQWDFTTITDFNVFGLPIMERGPSVPGNPEWPVQRWEWDQNENLTCHKDAAANAVSNSPCTTRGASTGVEAVQTEYSYQLDAPYLPTKIVHAAPATDAPNSRLTETFEYDAGFSGLQAHWYDNANLSGIPTNASLVENVNFDWGAGGPPEVPGRSDNFSARFFGDFRATHQSGEKAYVFNVLYDDKVRVAVGDSVIIDCWASTSCTPTKSVSLKPGNHPISVEFADTGGNAKIQLRQETSPGFYPLVPRSQLAPNIDAMTSALKSTGTTTLERRSYVYPQGQEYRRLPSLVQFDGIRMNAPRSTEFEYDAWGKVRRQSDVQSNGREVKHSYDDNGCPIETRVVTAGTSQHVTAQTCNSRGNVLTLTDTVGGVVDDATGAVTQQTRVTSSEYDPLGRLKKVDHPDGGQDGFTYDLAGRIKTHSVKATSSETSTMEYFYTPQGWLSKILFPAPSAGAAQPEISYAHDAVGNRTRKVDERGKEWTYTFNSMNLRTSSRTPAGDTTVYGYDAAGRVVTSKRPEIVPGQGPSAIVTTSYDALGRVVSERLGELSPTRYEYDPRGLTTRKTDPDGVTVTWTYDAYGNSVTETAQVGSQGAEKTRNLTYDVFGQLVKKENFRGHLTEYTYDRRGLVQSVKLPHTAPNETTYTYNDAGELEQVRLPTTGTDAVEYDYGYDKMGRLIGERNGLGQTTTHTYDLAGQEVTSIDPRSVTYEYGYDRLGRRVLERATEAGVTTQSTFAFDAASNMTLASGPGGDVSITYDDAGRPDVVTAGTSSTDYDYVGGLLARRIDDAGTTTYEYSTPTGRLAEAHTPISPEPVVLAYSAAGRLTTRTDPNDVVHTMEYDVAGRMKSTRSVNAQGEEIAGFTQDFDADSHVVARSNTVATSVDNGAWTYGYDDAGRLRSTVDPQGVATTYDYDGAGNRTNVVESATVEGTTTSTTSTTGYDAAGRPASTTKSKTVGAAAPVDLPTTTYLHDAAGNLTTIDDGATKWTYGYDVWNRMVSSKKSLSPTDVPVSSTYTYDVLGRTIAKAVTLTSPAGSVTEQVERHSYAGVTDELVQSAVDVETPAATTSAQTEYGYAHGMAIGQQRTIETLVADATAPDVTIGVGFFGTGPHGDVTFLTGATGHVVSTKSYDPWGVVRTEVGDKVDLGFQADPTDRETGLVDMGTRYYLPSLGRFTTQDTYMGDVMEPLTENRYIYGLDDPLTHVDPTGQGNMYCDDNTCDSSEDLQEYRDASQHQAVAREVGVAMAEAKEQFGSPGVVSLPFDLQSVSNIATVISTVMSALETSLETGKSTRWAAGLFAFLDDVKKTPIFKNLGRAFNIVSYLHQAVTWIDEHGWVRGGSQTVSYIATVTGATTGGALLCGGAHWIAGAVCGFIGGSTAAVTGTDYVEKLYDALYHGLDGRVTPRATGATEARECSDDSPLSQGTACGVVPGDAFLCQQEGLVLEDINCEQYR